MNIEDLVTKYGNKLNKGELEVDSAELYGDLLDVKDKTDEGEFKYKDTIRMLIGMVESGYNPHSFYDTDIYQMQNTLLRRNK
ncbi:hypothetical protein phiA019_0009 [Aeromonas phage phiA019]|nr:hypothetical protein phiA009_0013 [Aeromonas phage phiA009]ULG01546.1 hypothetical protein phiA019_0009 [Aeromonas phage phiA019]